MTLAGSPLMEDRLRTIFQIVTDWLRFAEAKHGALLAANVAVLVIVAQSLANVAMYELSLVGRALLAASALISTVSFLPILRPGRQRPAASNATPTSLLYFNEVACVTPQRYLECLFSTLGEKRQPSRFEHDYAGQIVAISRIACHKFRLFNWAAATFLLGLVSCLFAY